MNNKLVRYVEWNTCAREALLTIVLLWFVAIGIAIRDYGRARKSFSAAAGYRPPTALGDRRAFIACCGFRGRLHLGVVFAPGLVGVRGILAKSP